MMWDKVGLIVVLVAMMLICAPVQSLSIRGAGLCPQAFVGKVEDVIEGQPPYTTLSKNEVIFKNLKTLRGRVSDKEVLSILKYGPLRLERGTTYLVSLRQKKICSIEPTATLNTEAVHNLNCNCLVRKTGQIYQGRMGDVEQIVLDLGVASECKCFWL